MRNNNCNFHPAASNTQELDQCVHEVKIKKAQSDAHRMELKNQSARCFGIEFFHFIYFSCELLLSLRLVFLFLFHFVQAACHEQTRTQYIYYWTTHTHSYERNHKMKKTRGAHSILLAISSFNANSRYSDSFSFGIYGFYLRCLRTVEVIKSSEHLKDNCRSD